MAENSSPSISFDGYDQAQRIGEGGMASVWKARQISLDRWVAIKVLAPEQCSEDEDIDRFQSEARIVAKMNHPAIVQVYDAFYRNDRFCFVMEYVDGYTVGSWLQNRGYLSQEECLFVASGVAEALDYAWDKQGLIHCDIKPENIMIDIDGSVKVTDFGLSKSLRSQQTRHSQDGVYVFGTPAYISPEQATGTKELSMQTDMYSMGASLYHMCTGKRLFAESSVEEVMESQVNGQYTDPLELNTNLSPFFCDFLERLLCKDRNDRYTDWKEVKADIDNLRQSRPLAFCEINPSNTKSTLRRSPLRDAARHDLLKKLRIDKRRPTRPADSATTPKPKHKLGVEIIVGDELHPQSAPQENKTYAELLKQMVSAVSTLVKNNRAVRIAIVSVVTLVVLIGFAVQVKNAENCRKQTFTKAVEAETTEIDNFFRVHPNEYVKTISRYDALLAELGKPCHSGLKMSVQAKRDAICRARDKNIELIMKNLRDEVRPLIEDRQYGKAASVVLDYDGDLAQETLVERTRMADMFTEQGSLYSKSRHPEP